MKKTNPFAIFSDTQKTAFIKAFDAEITYRELTMAEADMFNKRLVNDYKPGSGEPSINMDEVTAIAYEKIAMCLVEPAMTVEELQGLGASASKTIGEIGRLIDGKDALVEDALDDEGNQES